jgi:amino acid transporter
MVPAALGRLNDRAAVPANAIVLVTLVSIAGMALGKGALIPIINMATICITLILVLALCVLLRLRHKNPQSPGYAVPGGLPTILVCLAGALLMAGFAFFGPLLQGPAHLPLEWMLMAAWGALSLIFSRSAALR